MTRAKKMIAVASVIATIGASALGASAVFAAQHGSGYQNGMSGLVNALAQKFNLAPSDVQAVVDQQHQLQIDQIQKQSANRVNASLVQAVKDGKITQAQSDMIVAKHAEIKALEASLQGKTPADREAAMKTEMDSVKAWAQANNIPAQYVLPFRGGMMGRGGMMNREFRGRNQPKPAINGS